MLKSKISGSVQEVVLPDFPDDENTVTKSRRVSFGTNFVKEFIVGSAVSAQCMSEYEQAFSSSDSSNADSSHSAAEIGIPELNKFSIPEPLKVHKTGSTAVQPGEPELVDNRPKPSKFSRTICFSADSPTADMEFTEGCITLAKSILDKKNKEMTVIIQAVPKEPREEEKFKEDETKYFDSSQFEMSMTKCFKSKENKREEKRFESEKTKIFNKFEDEMSITSCNKIFMDNECDSNWVNCKENLMPLDMIMRHLDKDNSDLENDLFNPKKSFNNFLSPDPFDFSNDSEKLNLNESMDISDDFHPNVFKAPQKKTLHDDKINESKSIISGLSEKIISNESMKISHNFQPDLPEAEVSPLFFKKPNTDVSEKIFTNLPSDVHETSQRHEEPFQSEDKAIEEELINLKKSDEVNSVEPMEISDVFQPDLSEAEADPLFEKPSTDVSEKICTDLPSDVHEASQNSFKSDEAIDCVRKDKSECFEKVLPNTTMEIVTNTSHVNEKCHKKLFQSENKAIEEELTNFKKSDEVNLIEAVEISDVFQPDLSKAEEDTLFEKPSTDMSKKVCIDLQSGVYETFQSSIRSLEEADCVRKGKSECFEKVLPNTTMEIVTNIPRVNEVIQISLQSEDKAIEEELTNLKKIYENSVESKEICGELRAEQLPETVNHSSFDGEICNNKSTEFSDKPTEPTDKSTEFSDKPTEPSDKSTELSVSVKLNTSVKCDTDCHPQNNEKIPPEVESNHCEHLNENEAMEISETEAEAEASAINESSLLDEKFANEAQLNDLEKINSENISEITADNHLNVFETVENSTPFKAITVDNSNELRMNESVKISTNAEADVPEIRQNSSQLDDRIRKSIEFNSSNEIDEVSTWKKELSLVDIKVIENLKEQSKEPGCVWSLKDLRYPLAKTSGLISINCDFLESETTMNFYLKTSNDNSLDSCSIIKNSELNLNEEKRCRLPEYGLVIEFGFQELKKFFDERRKKVETIRHIPYFLDQINSFLFKMNSRLRQIYSILTLYPGSRLKGSILSFRLYSFPVFFSCVVSIDLKGLFRLSKSSLSFKNDFGTLNENKIREIFQKCLKNENPLCEFVVQSTNYLFDLEKKSGYVSKRRHIRLLPNELKL